MHDAEPRPEDEPLLEQDEPADEEIGEDVELGELRPLAASAEHGSTSSLLAGREADEADSPEDKASAKDDLIWTEAEEWRLTRKLDVLIMPLLMIAFFALQLDRGNIGNALTDYFLEDVEITQAQFNTGNQLLALGIVLWEIPSNFVLYRVGPSIWLSGQILAWGLVATLQSLQKGVGPYLAARFLLGSCESGFIPASLFTISRFYKSNETTKRFSIFFIGNHFASAVSGVIAYGILHMRGIFGLAGWQWLFIVEGTFTICIGLMFITLFPKSLANPTTLVGVRYFSERECRILLKRVIDDDPSKKHNHENITKEEIKATFTNWRLLAHVIATITGLAPLSGLSQYAPKMIASWGYGRLRANAMLSIGASSGLVLTVIWGTLADKFRNRGLVALAGLSTWWTFLLASRLLVYSTNSSLRFGFLTVAVAFAGTWHPVNGSWMALNAPTAGERSITMAILIMAANSAGVIGSQLFQAEDAPLYVTAWTTMVLLVSLGLVAMITANLQYRWLNRRLESKGLVERYQL